MNDAIARYLDCWNETDPGARRKLIDDAWAADASYIDPLAEAHGRDAIDGVVGFDVAVTNEAGQLTTVLGFLDKVPG
jgi:hypothetical protein